MRWGCLLSLPVPLALCFAGGARGVARSAPCWLFSALRGSPGTTDLWLPGRNSIQTTLGLSAAIFSIPLLFASVYPMLPSTLGELELFAMFT
ncbi:hypothetical protein V8D89_012028 [Ganoderma adspersum]